MKKVGIIGGFEFIGSYITLKFLSENYRVKVPTSNSKSGKKLLNISGLSANRNLEAFHGDLNNLCEIRNFVSDCDIIIHCGSPYSLNKFNEETQLYVPKITGTGPLLKIINEFPGIQKLIFITPPPNINSTSTSDPASVLERLIAKNQTNQPFQKAVHHAQRVQENTMQGIDMKRIELIFVFPAEVLDNTLISNKVSTSTALKHLFEKEINHDPVFKKILQQVKLKTLVLAENAADEVFEEVKSTLIAKKEFYSTRG